MKLLRNLALAATVATAPLSSQAAIQICIDDAAGGFSYVAGQCYNTAGSVLTGTFNLPIVLPDGTQILISTTFGEPIFGGGFGMDISTSGTLDGSSWIVGVAQTGLIGGFGGSTQVLTTFSTNNSNNGAASIETFVNSANGDLSAASFGTQVGIGGPFTGLSTYSTSGSANISEPFSLLAFITLTDPAGGGTSSFSTDLQMKVPEPATLGLLGLGLAGIALLGRRRR